MHVCSLRVHVFLHSSPKKGQETSNNVPKTMTHSFSILFRDFFILLRRYYVMDGTEFPPHPRHVELELTSPLRDFIFGTWGCSEEAAADRGIWDWLKEIEFFREKPWVQKSSVCLGACDACDFSCTGLKGNIRGPCVLCIRS